MSVNRHAAQPVTGFVSADDVVKRQPPRDVPLSAAAEESLERGLADARAGRVARWADFTQYAHEPEDE